ncbi:MAG: SpoIIE family protein phosphatase [Lachnospiraceae bacterium]|nr:SpoIIE family protein phosphatase [Lachnospiraceae bacterium]
MHVWIVAMLVISALLIIRDMAKTIFSLRQKQEDIPAGQVFGQPQKERVEKYAQAFRKLADTFYGMPYRKDYLSNEQAQDVVWQAYSQVCSNCHQRQECWDGEERLRLGEKLVRALESGKEERRKELSKEWKGQCVHAYQFTQELNHFFQREREKLVWNNRMIENRLAAAQQFSEISGLLGQVAWELSEIVQPSREFADELRYSLKKKGIRLKSVWIMEREGSRKQAYLTMQAKNGQCVSALEAAEVLSELWGDTLVPVNTSRCTINGESRTVHFTEKMNFQALYGVAKVPKDKERVSGDSYACCQEEEGKLILCLSDGMGSGMEASKESEMVVDLLEQFLESGFTNEAAAKLVNSAVILKRQDDMFSTMDLCTIDLYTGVCEFLKAGAATTFIRRDQWVEAITSTSLALGMGDQIDFETTSRKLYSGDFLIMVTDGVLDALPLDKEEETMKEIILQVHSQAPREMGRGILDRALAYCDYKARDDMTVLVAGIWKK